MDNIKVSYYKNARAVEPVTVALYQFLFSKKHIDKVQAVRQATDKTERDNLKKTLPCATISGVFERRNIEGLKEYNALVCLDFDGKDNPDKTPDQIKEILRGINEIWYAGLSVSGAGVFAIVQTNNDAPDQHPRMVEFLEKIFLKLGLVIDKACKDVSRLRFISYDPEPYLNATPSVFDAQKYLGSYIENTQLKQLEKATLQTNEPYTPVPDKTRNRVEALIQKIESQRIDITTNYQDWILIGMSLASEFGHDGYSFFCRVSQFNEGFNYGACNEKYLNLLKSTNKVKIGTFFELCKINNITLK